MKDSLDDYEARLRGLRPNKLSEKAKRALESAHAETSARAHPGRRRIVRWAFLSATAAAAVVLFSVFFSTSSHILDRSWALEATGGEADFEVAAPFRVELRRGEIRVSQTGLSPVGPRATGEAGLTRFGAPGLRIDTPHGTLTTTNAEFFVGTHREV